MLIVYKLQLIQLDDTYEDVKFLAHCLSYSVSHAQVHNKANLFLTEPTIAK